jgi:hypothetical protein
LQLFLEGVRQAGQLIERVERPVRPGDALWIDVGGEFFGVQLVVRQNGSQQRVQAPQLMFDEPWCVERFELPSLLGGGGNHHSNHIERGPPGRGARQVTNR